MTELERMIAEIDEEETPESLLRRAISAYVLRADELRQVDFGRSGAEVHVDKRTGDEKVYVVLRESDGGILAVYRYYHDAAVRKLTVWPEALQKEASDA